MNFNPEHRGILKKEFEIYGKSVLGSPLLYFPCDNKCEMLVIAGIHGEEGETTFLLSRAFRLLENSLSSVGIILCANPDGMSLGTRGNFHGVDLNRNFPTNNWERGPVFSRSVLESVPDTHLSGGKEPSSESEVKSLISLIEVIKPELILSIHSPMACIESQKESGIVKKLESVFFMPWVQDIGYRTPGSLGTWCKEKKIDCITLELPRCSTELLFERYGISFARFLEEF